jgi:hypothetical protein
VHLVGEQNVRNHMGVRINPAAQLQPVTHVRRFKMLNALDMVQILFLLCAMFARHSELRSVLQGLIPELIMSQKCHAVYVHMGPICNSCWVWSN